MAVDFDCCMIINIGIDMFWPHDIWILSRDEIRNEYSVSAQIDQIEK